MMRLKAKHIGPIGRIRRIGEAVDDAVMYVYDGDHVIAEYLALPDGASELIRKYVYGPGIDRPVAMINVDGETETWYYYHQDALGSVVALSNSSGNLVERYRYTPFGKQSVYNAADTYIGSTSAYGNPYMFTARRYDAETGLYYYRARMYSPTLGRFLQTDPIGYFDSMNLYQYCGNNPMNWVDPWGLKFDIIGGIGNVVGKVWNAPNSAIGLVIGGAGLLFGGDAPVMKNNAITFTSSPFMLPSTGLTLGNVILYGEDMEPEDEDCNGNTFGEHEEQNTYQGQVLGPLYLPAHFIDKLFWGLTDGPLEVGPYSDPPRPWPWNN